MDARTLALLDTISYAEGTWRGGGQEGYRVMFGGGLADPGKTGGRHPDQVVHGGRVSSAAAGRYQFMPATWEAASKAAGVRPDQFFDPAAQDKVAAYLVSRRLGGTQLGDSLTPEVASKLAPEWASFPTASGSSYYPNQSVKKLGELDSFYRQRLAALNSGSGGAPVAAPVTASAGASPASASGAEMDWTRVLVGPEPEAGQTTEKRRFAQVGLAAPSLLDSVGGGRMAGEGAASSGVDFSDPAQNPFLAAVGGGQKQVPAPAAAAPQGAPARAADPFMTAVDGLLDDAPAAVAAPVKPAGGGAGLIGELGVVDLGKRLQGLGFKVAENSAFGGVGKHSHGSLHYSDNALDLTIQPNSPLLAGRKDSEWRDLTRQWGEKLQAALPGAEIFHPGNDPHGHGTHIHVGTRSGRFKLGDLARQLGFG